MTDNFDKQEILELIEITDTKDDLEELIVQTYSIDLNKRKSLENLKKDAIAIVNGTYETLAKKQTDPEAEGNEKPPFLAGEVAQLMGELSEDESDEPPESTPATIEAKKIVAGHVPRFLRKKGGRILNWSASLAGRADIYECDSDGKVKVEFEEVGT